MNPPPIGPRPFTTSEVALGAAAFVAMILIPRTTAVLVPLVLAGLIVLSRSPPSPRDAPSLLSSPPVLALLGCLSWFAVRGSWPPPSAEGAINILLLLAYVVLPAVALRRVARVEPVLSDRERFAFAVAFAAAAILLAFHIASDQWAARRLLDLVPSLRSTGSRTLVVDGSVVAINDGNINRQVVVLMLLTWPVWLMTSHRRSRYALGAAIVALAGVVAVVASARSETAKLALAASLVLFVLNAWRPRIALVLAAAGWTVAVFLVVPLAIALHGQGWHHSDQLFDSARARVVVWNEIATRTLERPVIGHGLAAMRKDYYAPQSGEAQRRDAETGLPAAAPHAHNVYLQVWYEFGAVGALWLGIAGYAVLGALRQMPPPVRAAGLAQFGAVAAILSSGYGLWQAWLHAAIAYSAFLLLRASPPAAPPGARDPAGRG